MIDLSIIIPTRNRGDDTQHTHKIYVALKECLASLLDTTRKIEIVVVSNGGDPKPIPVIPRIDQLVDHNTHRIRRVNVWEQGQCKAVNAAVATTNTEWIMVTNDDMIYPPHWLSKLTKEHDYECFSPKLVEPTKGAPTFIQYNCGGAGGDFFIQQFWSFAKNYDGKGWQTGFNLPFIMKRELWDKIGGYDINYDPWSSNSDSDLEYKLKLAGIQPMQSQETLVYHFSQTSGTFHPDHQTYWQNNWEYFISKWGFPRTDDGIWEANFKIPYELLKFKPFWAKLPLEDNA